MSTQRLGRGFSSLIPTDLDGTFDPAFDPTAKEDEKSSKLHEIKLDDIVPDDNQPRRDFKPDQLNALARSIALHGVLQPIVVTKDGRKYRLVAGERRWRASKIAGLKTIPAIIRTLDAQNRLELSLIENVQREDLNAIETATAYAKLRDQFNLSIADIATRVSKSNSAVVNTLRLLTLPEDVKRDMLRFGLSEGQMRPLVTATPEQIDAVLPKIIAEGWSARKVEQYMVEQKAKRDRADLQPPHESGPSLEYSFSEARAGELSEHLGGIKVKIRTNTRGSGEIVLKFKNQKEFDKLCSILNA